MLLAPTAAAEVCIHIVNRRNTTHVDYALKMTTAQVVETSVSAVSNSPIQDYVHPDDHAQTTYEMTPGFKPFTYYI